MAGSTTCRVCGQANDSSSEFCVRCGEKLPDPSSTQLVSQPGGAEAEGPWEPPAEWDPGELPPSQQQTWVGRQPDQVGWNTGQDTGAGTPPPAPWQPQPQLTPGGPVSTNPRSKKPLIFGLGALVIVAAIVVVIVLVAGGGKGGNSAALNGEQTKTASDVLDDTRVALRNAKSVHLNGNVVSNSQRIRLDMDLAGPGAQGTLTIKSNDVQLIRTADAVYIKADPDFLKQYVGNNQDALNQLNGRWLKTAVTSDFESFNLDGFANVLKPDTNGTKLDTQVTKDKLNGQPVVVLTSSDGSKLYVANTGQPYPLKLDGKGNTGQITFSNYNANVSITPPPSDQVLDLTQTPSPSPTPSPSDSFSTSDLAGDYTCTPKNGGSGGGTLTLNADRTYAVSGGAQGGSWAIVGDQVAMAGGALDGYGGTYDGVDTIDLKGSGSNSSVEFNCVFQ